MIIEATFLKNINQVFKTFRLQTFSNQNQKPLMQIKAHTKVTMTKNFMDQFLLRY